MLIDRLGCRSKQSFANECLSPVSTTPAVNSCHGFSEITGVVNTGDKFITGVNNTGEQLSLETVTPAQLFFFF
jgi:hypothetical protein